MEHKNNIDVVDVAILRELKNNCKQSYRTLASKLGIHPNTLMQRIKKLEKEKFIRAYHADIDFEKIGYDLFAFVTIKLRMGISWERELITTLVNIPQIQGLFPVAGAPDAIALVYAKDKGELADVLRKIQKTDVVIKTTTYIALDIYKRVYDFNPL